MSSFGYTPGIDEERSSNTGRKPTMRSVDVLGATIWETTVPWFFGADNDDEIVVDPETGSCLDWIDEGLIPPEHREE